MASKKETIDDFLNEVVEEQAAAPKKTTAPVVETKSTEAVHEHGLCEPGVSQGDRREIFSGTDPYTHGARQGTDAGEGVGCENL